MKTPIKSIYAGVAVAALCVAFCGCNEPEDGLFATPQVGDIQFTELSSIAEMTGAKVPLLHLKNEYFIAPWGEGNVYIVNSHKQLKKYVNYDYSWIDFKTKSVLLIGGAGRGRGPFLSEVRGFRFTSKGTYELDVEIEDGTTYEASWKMAILTDKMSSASKIELNVTVNEPNYE
jgi:hypothetical protein